MRRYFAALLNWGLRDYKIPPSVWGGDPECEHAWGAAIAGGESYAGSKRWQHSLNGRGELQEEVLRTRANSPETWAKESLQGQFCGRCDGWLGALGLEPTPELYIEHLVNIFREVRRVLRDDGTLWLNLGDSYAGSGGAHSPKHANPGISHSQQRSGVERRSYKGRRGPDPKRGDAGIPGDQPNRYALPGLKALDLIGVPWRAALALQADGWYLRGDIVWCLSGGAWVYTRTKKGDMPMMVREIARLNPATVQLWNGEKWTQVLGISPTVRDGSELELVLRSGERISCTPTHKFPTNRGLVGARDLVVGDTLIHVQLPEPDNALNPEHIGPDAAWLAGLYLAEGSRSEDTIQIAGHIKEEGRWDRVLAVAKSYGGSATRTVSGNEMDIRIYGKVLVAIIDSFIGGRTAKDKHVAPGVWRYGNTFLQALLDGYLAGDGHWDASNRRWRLGFTRNYSLERDLRTLSARLGWSLTLNPATMPYNGGTAQTFRGEIRMVRTGHPNEKDRGEIMAIRSARGRVFYALGVEDAPHVFALASGVLTHNSKPNPMPESVAGWRWERCRVKVAGATRGSQSYTAATSDSRGHARPDHSGSNNLTAEWTNCPGCPKCEASGGFVFRRGAWRPTRSHEYVFLLAKSDRYYGDGTDIREALASGESDLKKMREAKDRVFSRYAAANDPFLSGGAGRIGRKRAVGDADAGRNARSVWEIATQPFTGAHFATYPQELVRRCILSGTPDGGCCRECGAPWARIVASTPMVSARSGAAPGGKHDRTVTSGTMMQSPSSQTLGWRPTCEHGSEPMPAVVLDPFVGSGTTLLVAKRLGRRSIGIDLNPGYLDMAAERLRQLALMENLGSKDREEVWT